MRLNLLSLPSPTTQKRSGEGLSEVRMKTWTDTTYYPDARERLSVVPHPEAVTVLLGGCLASNGQGFSVRFETAHLDALRKAVAHLEHVAAQQAQAADDDPFPEAA
jgi:hypothetical protein